MDEQADRLTYSVAEAAMVLGISRSYCYELIQQGVLPYLPLGRRKLIPRASLERYVNEQARRHHAGSSGSGLLSATAGEAGDGTETMEELAGGFEPPT
jgi:excisionase family DNA binding protein